MEGLTHRAPLRLRFGQPSVGARPINSCRRPAGSGRNAVKDRPIQGLVDDLVRGGHGLQPLFSNAVVLADQLRRVAFERTSLLNGNAA